MKKDYYSILGITKDASNEHIKKAYRKLAMQYHPDRNPGKEQWANEKFKEINEAYGVLGDPVKRRQYDSFGTTGNPGDIFSSSFTRSTFEDLMRDYKGAGLNVDFMDNIFGQLFKNLGFSFHVYTSGFETGRGESGGAYGIGLDQIFQKTKHQQNKDVTYEIFITAEQAAQGLEKDLKRKGKKLRVKIPSDTKNGTRIRLRNARKITDGTDGDILVRVKVK